VATDENKGRILMDLQHYFATHSGTGVLSTANSKGQVNSAIYARPHVLDDGTVAMIMLGRLTYQNLTENPYAHFLFIEKGDDYRGLRISLKKQAEETNPDLIAKMRRHSSHSGSDEAQQQRYILYFTVEKVLELIGGQEVTCKGL